MKTVIKNFYNYLRQFPAAALLNVAGLAVSLAVFIMIVFQIKYDVGYDRCFALSSEIYKVERYNSDNGSIWRTTPYSFAAKVRDEIAEVKNVVLIQQSMNAFHAVGPEGEYMEPVPLDISYASGDFFDLFETEIVIGTAVRVLTEKGFCMISEKSAEKLFGTTDCLGSTIDYFFDEMSLTVDAVFRDFPSNTNIENGIYTCIDEPEPEKNWNYGCHLHIDPSDLDVVVEKLNNPNLLHFTLSDDTDMPDYYFRLHQFDRIHLFDDSFSRPQLPYTLTSAAIALVILLIAFINLLNFSIAMAPSRVRSINTHRILGAGRWRLRMLLASESVLTAALSVVVALFLVLWFGSTAMAGYFTADLSPVSEPALTVACIVFYLTAAFVAGIFAANFTTSFDIALALKGSPGTSASGVRLRNILVTLQFTAAITLISVSAFFFIQHKYMIDQPWGFDRENVVYSNSMSIGSNYSALRNDLLENPSIKGVSASHHLPGTVYTSWGFPLMGKYVDLTVWGVDKYFFELFGINIIAGSLPDNPEEYAGGMFFNRKFLEAYGFDESIVGYNNPQEIGHVRGIVENFNFESLHNYIKPMAFAIERFNDDTEFFSHVFIKISPENVSATMKYIAEVWSKYSTMPFNGNFVDEHIDSLYTSEKNMSKLIGFFGVVVVLIALMGVYGMILFNTKYRRREIGIRKVSGASIWQIMTMLNRQMLLLLGAAFVIAVPIFYFVVNKWLTGFAYKAPVPAWLLPATLVVVLVIDLAVVSYQSWQAASANPVDVIKNE